MARGYLKWVLGPAAAILVAACSSEPYSARPVDPDAMVTQFLARSADAGGLKTFAVANGYAARDWPPQQWTLKELTLVALYFHGDIRTAQARADVARAELRSAAQTQAWSARFKPEYHSQKLAYGDGPWTLGVELEIPLVAQSKRAARAERNAFLADAAELDIASAAWTVRARVRDHYLDLQESRDALESLDAQLDARKNMVGVVTRRVDAGMLSSRELGAERVAYSQLELLRSHEMARQQRALGELAAALGLPLDVVERMKLRFDALPPPQMDMDAGALRRLTLRNRLDVHRKLLEFGAADAEVKSAVAAQNPDIMIGPGYNWDQGDNIWSLAIGISVPQPAQSRASIREAQARRELAAEQFAATQADAISLVERAAAQYQLAHARMAAAEHQLQMQREQEARVNRQFDTGAADRMQRITAHIDTLASETILQASIVELHHAIAHLEDAVQRPLLGDFAALPPPRPAMAADQTAVAKP